MSPTYVKTNRLKNFALPMAVAAALLAPASAQAASGGSVVIVTPVIKKIECARTCAKKKAIQAGSLLRLKGEDLDVVKQVQFLGSQGKADDTIANVVTAKPNVATVRVPADTSTGAIVAISATGVKSRPSRPIGIRPLPPVIGSPDLQVVPGSASGVTLETGTSTPRVVFFGAKQLVRFSLRVTGVENATAAVTLIRQSTGAPVQSWSVPVPAGQIASVDWNGNVGGKPGPAGRYAFTVSINGSAGVLASSAGATSKASAAEPRDAFDLYGFMFPVRGKHNYGGASAAFGAGRSGHIHQGQDVMSACGLKLVAARGGTVVQSTFQSLAGNYIVIRPDGGIGDQAYMHLTVKSPFKPGDHVYTGQVIGNVGQTGDATACHLHFEEWTGAIWESKVFNPLPDLLAWDQVS
jgi:murein DD-endopeptidase MepM/ murein hydrolase activator NlpD